MEHTKGTWKATRWNIGDGWRVHVLHTADNDTHDAICDLETWQTDKETVANARLIAAAPELLEALKTIIGGENRYEINYTDYMTAVSAIARAEGRE